MRRRAARILLERDAEIGVIDRAVTSAVQGSGSLVIVEGEAGIGKTTVLDHAVATAGGSGATVLRAMASELEQSDPFGVVRSLFAPAVRSPSAEEAAYNGPAAGARAVIAPSGANSPTFPTDPSAAMHALYWLALNLAEADPLVLVVDDAHWIDEPSARFLGYLANRIADAPITLVLAFRPLVEGEVAEALRTSETAHRLRLAPLSREAVAGIARHLGIEAEETQFAAVWTSAHGNPFYIAELLRDLEAAPAGGLDSGASVPETIARSIAARMGTPTGPVRRVAEAIAILGDHATVDRIVRLTALPEDEVTAAVRRMTQKGLLEHARLAFSHPIVRSAVHGGVPAAVREQLHRAAGRILHETGAPISAIAAQLLATGPGGDPFVVRSLRAAATSAAAQGDPAGAAVQLRRALAEPAGDETGGILLDLAHAEAALGLPSAPDRYEEALAHVTRAHERGQIRLAQGHALISMARWAEAVPVFAAGLTDVGERELELKSRLEAGYVSSSFVGLVDQAAAEERLRRILATPLTDPAHRELAAWTAFQQTTALSASAAEAAALARRSLAGAPLDDLVRGSQVVELVAGVFVATGDLDDEIDLLDRSLVTAERMGIYGKVAIYSYCRAVPHLLIGRLADAIADAQTAIAAHEHGWDAFYSGSCSSLAWALIEIGEPEAAQQVVTLDDARWRGQLDFEFMIPIARGRVRLALGDPGGALDHFERVRATGELLGVRTTSVLADWRTWQAVALSQLGRRAEARRVADEALELAERWAAPLARAQARWAAGIVEREAGLDTLREALELIRATPARLLETRIGLALGEALRRSGKTVEARQQLSQTADLARRIGARGVLERARDELTAAGARPRRDAVTGPAALTPSELRVARLATEGRTNREVAQALFVTPKAVEFHLANAYRKLGISSRADLAGALRDEGAASV